MLAGTRYLRAQMASDPLAGHDRPSGVWLSYLQGIVTESVDLL
jgi:hypothetical protein